MNREDGVIYEGMWANNVRHSTGTQFQVNGIIYHGGWKNNLKDGYGEQVFPDGNKLVGQWKRGQMQGGVQQVAPDGTEGHSRVGAKLRRGVKKSFIAAGLQGLDSGGDSRSRLPCETYDGSQSVMMSGVAGVLRK
jgi:hypothetical protein